MINTRGFQISQLPAYTPVEPSLQGFNPTNVAQGALEGLKVSSTLEQLKSFREQQEEWRKLAEIRTGRIKDEAERVKLELEHAKALQQIGIESEKARLLALKDLFPVEAKTKVMELGARQELIPGETSLARLTQQLKTGQTEGALTRLPSENEAQRITAESAAKLAPINAEIALTEAEFKKEVLPDQLDSIRQKLANDLSLATTERAIKLAHDAAQTKLLLAQADNFSAQAEGVGRYEKDPFIKYQKMEQVESQIQNKIQNIWRREVTLPNGQVGKLSDYWAATRKPTGEPQRSGIPFINRSDVAKNPEAEALIADAQELLKRRAALITNMASMDLSAVDEIPPGPPVGTIDSGYRFNGGNPKDPKSWTKVNP